MSEPKVTVVLVVNVTEGNLEERINAPFQGKTLPTIKSVEDQTWPHELLIMRNVEDHPIEWMMVEALKRVETDWVTFVDDGEVWPTGYLRQNMRWAHRTGTHTVMESDKPVLLDITRSPLTKNYWKD